MTDEADTDAAPSEDVVVLGSESPDGKSVGVVRLREGQVEIGKVQPLEEGKPIVGEVVKLTPRAEAPRICDVEVQYKPTPVAKASPQRTDAAPPRTRGGPPQVASDEYRRNWEAIWAPGKKPN
ncbi:MAG: hypothetical protein HS104_33655 [Polyangiaceae bacterium]|nr:hypothetical protein [Polyangiaceae bacterium]MCE7890257.1 hypothetical protein [Sorangiineae bacterium PRO1]MCL4755422.1 hypothetical protein [Myxococcales bacterium]